ncbi:MAG: hypothetical protein NT120_04360 [Candidatus Aenigmarchaeota archaeon]|nr:hypothetical protein [Candidatus Aenigmarchaeota archaeon]
MGAAKREHKLVEYVGRLADQGSFRECLSNYMKEVGTHTLPLDATDCAALITRASEKYKSSRHE